MCRLCGRSYDRYAFSDGSVSEAIRWAARRARRFAATAMGAARGSPRAVLSFDAEASSLHGEAFAVGAVLLRAGGGEESFFARCPVGVVDPWVARNVLPSLEGEPETHATPRLMRDAFWLWMSERMRGAVVVGDCSWPVEAGLLSACVGDDPSRAFAGPYPLHEVATLMLAAGLSETDRHAAEVLPPSRLGSHRAHHPTDDARVSALYARMALGRIGGLAA